MLTDQHTGAQVASDQGKQRFVADGSSQQIHQHVVIDGVKELCQIDIHGNAATFLDVVLDLPDRLMGIATRSEPIACRAELRFVDGAEMACWMTRSITVGMPSSRLPPSSLGISTQRTAGER